MDNYIIEELGQDVELLVKPDAWLENQRINLQSQLSSLADELHKVITAQRLKRTIQQTNKVAVRRPIKQENTPLHFNVKIKPLPDAIEDLKQDTENVSLPTEITYSNEEYHLTVWKLDGYDIKRSTNMRS